ncbi:TlpA family protein disulfide reductase [Halorhabdus salina]|uniref:TlpA family protein disulfide reductase n=1 Tax=Halorhabdus salina TaxID=2750670 RepID=UPI0015EE3B65|nr:TlpA disulfide reductase family protein [Halorhabdus salina]
MRRRDLLAGLGGAAVVATGSYVALSGASGDVDPVTVDLFDTAESSGKTMQAPTPGELTVLDLFATTCPPCVPALDALSNARADAGDVQFLSVTSEYLGGGRTRTNVTDWWAEHGGHWPVGYDKEGRLMRQLDVGSLPHTAVIDSRGNVAWSHTGVPDANRIHEAIEQVR